MGICGNTRVMTVPYLIDGYNLLHAAGLVAVGTESRRLERARRALLALLASRLPERERTRTTVVFDAARAPWRAPGTQQFRGITIRFAVRYQDADELVEELIAADSAPKSLVVVSDDRRLQRTARRRKARAVGCEDFLRELHRARTKRAALSGKAAEKTPVRLSPAEVEALVQEFSAGLSAEEIEELSGPFPSGYGDGSHGAESEGNHR